MTGRVVHFEGGEVFATADPRVVRTRLLPYNEIGNTNLGRFEVPKGSLTLPADPDVLAMNLDHAQQDNVARCVGLEDLADGVYASWRYATTAEADAALADALSPTGTRRSVSAEFGPAVIRAGKLVSAKLWGAAQVARGAFPSAMVLAADADSIELADDLPAVLTVPEDGTLALETTTLPEVVTATVTDADGETVETATYAPVVETEQEGASDVTATRVPPTTPSGRPRTPVSPPEGTPTPANIVAPSMVFAALARIHSGQDGDGSATKFLMEQGGSEQVFAALNDIKYGTGVGAGINQIPDWLGKLYEGRTFARKFSSLFGPSKTLTSMKVAGWQWGTKPTGGDYAGDKANVPSNTPTVDPYADLAWRFAGGHDHDRAYVDFSNPEYWESYWSAMVESYEKWLDSKSLTKLLSVATEVEADDPTGLTIGAGLSALIDGAVEVLEADALPSFAVMSLDLYKKTLKTPADNVLGYLNASLGLEEGTLSENGFRILGSSQIEAGHVLVGAREAASVYELGGGTPVRVDALDMVKGGVDTGLFGYASLYVHKADAIVDVAPYVAGP